MKEINQSEAKIALKTSTEIVIPAKTEVVHIGDTLLTPGLKLFSMDLRSLLVEEVDTKTIQGVYNFDNPTQIIKKVTSSPTVIYVQALNRKVAMKKFGKRLAKTFGTPPKEALHGNS